MSWETTWLSQDHEARRRWYVDHPGQSDPSFWELNFSPGDQDITGAIRGVAEAIECHTGYHPLAVFRTVRPVASFVYRRILAS